MTGINLFNYISNYSYSFSPRKNTEVRKLESKYSRIKTGLQTIGTSNKSNKDLQDTLTTLQFLVD